jgi:uncharacterized protein with beta-barrel porin domain
VDLTGSVVTHAAGTSAIVAQSKAVEGNGNIAINLNSTTGLVKGGATDADHIGVGVWIVDGNDNTISNKGTITTASGTAGGWAILSGAADEAVTNYGTVTGSVDLGAGYNGFTNIAGATFNAGMDAKFGAGNLFSDGGYFSPGGDGKAMTTNLVGNWDQSATGTYELDVDLNAQSDLINVDGTAVLAGAVGINILNPAAAKPGSQDFLILHADDGVTDNGFKLSAIPSAVAHYELDYPNPEDVFLNVDIDYAPVGLTGNQAAVGTTVNRIQTDLSSPGFARVAEALFYVPTLEQLGSIFSSMSGEGVSGFEQPQLDAYGTFLSAMTRQSDFWRTGLGTGPSDQIAPQAYDEPKGKGDQFDVLEKVPDERRWSYWAAAGGSTGELAGHADLGSAENEYKGGSLSAGFDSVGDPDMLVGFALGGAAMSFAVPDRDTSGNIIGGQVGAHLTRKWDQFYINGALAVGLYNNSIDRRVGVPGSNAPLDPVAGLPTEHWKSKFLSAGFGTSVEAGWRQTVGDGAVTPFAGVQFSTLSAEDFDETSINGGALGLNFDSRAVLSLPVSLGLQLDTTVKVGGGQSLQAWARAAWVHEFEPERSVRPEFQAAPGYTFVIQGAAAAEDAVAVDAGLKMNLGANTSMFTTFDGKFGDDIQTYGGNVGVKVNW